MSDGPEIAGWTEKWVQDGDCNTNEGDYQYLDIESQNNGVECYFIIKTERWALDGDEKSIDEFAAMLKKFMKIEPKSTVHLQPTLIQEDAPKWVESPKTEDKFEPFLSHLAKVK